LTDQALDLWRSALLTGQHGEPRPTEANCSLFLRCSEVWHDRIRYNSFTGQIEWRQKGSPGWADLRDHDAVTVQDELQRGEGVGFRLTAVNAALDHAAHANEYHPVREYLDGLKWDGEPRTGEWLERYLGAEPISSRVGRWWLVSAVARAMRPGCKADHMMVLEGRQGVGKSTALSILGGEWYSETLSDLRNAKDAYQDLAGAWIVEIAELDAMRGAAATRIKSFLSSSRDKYRPSYGRRSTYHPRQCVFAATTNESQYLEDATGARRMWPIRMRYLRREELLAIRDQLWAEARYYWSTGMDWWPSLAQEKHLAALADERRVIDPWESVLASWLEARAVGFEPSITTADVLTKLEMPPHQRTRREEMRAGRVLRSLGWRPCRSGTDRSRGWRPATNLEAGDHPPTILPTNLNHTE
jgi:putative DNA primase/helicase